MKSLGVNPQVIAGQMTAAVKAISDRFDRVEQRLEKIEKLLTERKNNDADISSS